MLKVLFITSIFSVFTLITFGQTAYIATDTSIISGVKIIENSAIVNSEVCQVVEGNSIVEYTPNDLIEYVLENGRAYVSRDISIGDSIKRVFLERIVKGKTTLYYYKSPDKKTFFIEKDSAAIFELPKKSGRKKKYTDALFSITEDCDNVKEVIPLVSYRNRSLSKFVSQYNKCEKKPFPHFRIGLTVGYEYVKFMSNKNVVNKDLAYFDFEYDKALAISLFVDQPIATTDVSIYGEILYTEHGYSYNKLLEHKDVDLVGNMSSIRVPLLVKYAYPSNYIRPYLCAGFITSINIKNETMFYEMTRNRNSFELVNFADTSPLVSDVNIGYCIGGGAEIKITARHSFLLEFRYSNPSAFSLSDPLKLSGFNVVSGLMF